MAAQLATGSRVEDVSGAVEPLAGGFIVQEPADIIWRPDVYLHKKTSGGSAEVISHEGDTD